MESLKNLAAKITNPVKVEPSEEHDAKIESDEAQSSREGENVERNPDKLILSEEQYEESENKGPSEDYEVADGNFEELKDPEENVNEIISSEEQESVQEISDMPLLSDESNSAQGISNELLRSEDHESDNQETYPSAPQCSNIRRRYYNQMPYRPRVFPYGQPTPPAPEIFRTVYNVYLEPQRQSRASRKRTVPKRRPFRRVPQPTPVCPYVPPTTLDWYQQQAYVSSDPRITQPNYGYGYAVPCYPQTVYPSPVSQPVMSYSVASQSTEPIYTQQSVPIMATSVSALQSTYIPTEPTTSVPYSMYYPTLSNPQRVEEFYDETAFINRRLIEAQIDRERIWRIRSAYTDTNIFDVGNEFMPQHDLGDNVLLQSPTDPVQLPADWFIQDHRNFAVRYPSDDNTINDERQLVVTYSPGTAPTNSVWTALSQIVSATETVSSSGPICHPTIRPLLRRSTSLPILKTETSLQIPKREEKSRQILKTEEHSESTKQMESSELEDTPQSSSAGILQGINLLKPESEQTNRQVKQSHSITVDIQDLLTNAKIKPKKVNAQRKPDKGKQKHNPHKKSETLPPADQKPKTIQITKQNATPSEIIIKKDLGAWNKTLKWNTAEYQKARDFYPEFPSVTVPTTTVVEEIVPEAAVVEEIIPEAAVVEETVPEISLVEKTVPEAAVVEETNPTVSIVEQIVPQIIVEEIPEESTVEKIVLETAIVDEVVPEAAIVEETVPEVPVVEEIVPKSLLVEDILAEINYIAYAAKTTFFWDPELETKEEEITQIEKNDEPYSDIEIMTFIYKNDSCTQTGNYLEESRDESIQVDPDELKPQDVELEEEITKDGEHAKEHETKLNETKEQSDRQQVKNTEKQEITKEGEHGKKHETMQNETEKQNDCQQVEKKKKKKQEITKDGEHETKQDETEKQSDWQQVKKKKKKKQETTKDGEQETKQNETKKQNGWQLVTKKGKKGGKNVKEQQSKQDETKKQIDGPKIKKHDKKEEKKERKDDQSRKTVSYADVLRRKT